MPQPQIAEYLLQHAKDARSRGDVLLHLQFDVAQLTGETSSWGSAENRIQRDDQVGYLLSQVEALGWRLEHTGYVFVESGSTSSARMFSTGAGVVNHGGVEGMFTFRRV
ncbi:hypothetical protein L2X99_13170 [Microbacterium sp. KUDC0406]|uniref:hypothetical protein n=1 Tax=Microbacterium sp. KUDC0406 TaxID=2909588 RepID=UPI001F3DBA39|nr:hypothetical protein [Microbacterium sp. KUDC0406]UJP09373.1 hypothetical protein L2X99_13170 [Microbacterium sp. KUDC0406]